MLVTLSTTIKVILMSGQIQTYVVIFVMSWPLLFILFGCIIKNYKDK